MPQYIVYSMPHWPYACWMDDKMRGNNAKKKRRNKRRTTKTTNLCMFTVYQAALSYHDHVSGHLKDMSENATANNRSSSQTAEKILA